jgi:hypothetical protein
VIAWLADDGRVAGRLVLASDLKRVYPLLCRSFGWEPFAWNTLARDLRKMTGGRKRYIWHSGKRVRAYPVPRPSRREPRSAFT